MSLTSYRTAPSRANMVDRLVGRSSNKKAAGPFEGQAAFEKVNGLFPRDYMSMRLLQCLATSYSSMP